MPGLGLQWGFSFYVNESSTFEDRYQEVLAAHPVPPNSVTDVASAHDAAVVMIASKGIIVPMTVAINGWFDSDNVKVNLTVTITQN